MERGKQNAAPEGGEGKYSLKAFKDGRRFVDVEIDQEQFDGLSKREQGRLATKIIKSKFLGRVIGLDNRAYVKSLTATEYGFPRKDLGPEIHEAKMRASTELDNLMDAGSNFRTEPDGRDGHIHPDATGDFQYFDTIFKVGTQYYTGVINIMPTAHGLVLKDITKIRNITQDIGGSYGDNPQATFLRDTSIATVAQDRHGVKPQYSLRQTAGSEGPPLEWAAPGPQAAYLQPLYRMNQEAQLDGLRRAYERSLLSRLRGHPVLYGSTPSDRETDENIGALYREYMRRMGDAE